MRSDAARLGTGHPFPGERRSVDAEAIARIRQLVEEIEVRPARAARQDLRSMAAWQSCCHPRFVLRGRGERW